MSPRTMDAVIDRVLADEGGYVNHPDDHGGITNYGLTIPFLESVTGRSWTPDQVAQIKQQTARGVYSLWLQMKRLDTLPDDVDLAFTVVDYAVHSGERTAIKAVQRALGVTQDGVIGPETQSAWQRLNFQQRDAVRKEVLALRLEHIGRIVRADPKQSAFISGWLNRVAKQVRV